MASAGNVGGGGGGPAKTAGAGRRAREEAGRPDPQVGRPKEAPRPRHRISVRFGNVLPTGVFEGGGQGLQSPPGWRGGLGGGVKANTA